MTLQYQTNLPLPEQVVNHDERLRILEERFSELGFDMKGIVTTEVKRNWRVMPQSISMFGMMTALCVGTVDPWKQNRVQFYSPLLHDPDTAVEDLPFASPISSMGGIDDCGLNWVPPAGSMLCLIFEHGARWAPYYIGTTWSRDRGPAGQHNWGYPMPEYDKVSAGHRKGYILPPDDESQVLPPWNTESSNGKDINNIGQYENDPEAKKKITSPNVYGIKTPEKHMIKMVDGDYKCGRRFKRMEFQSGGKGGWIMMKDDPIHPSGQWAHPDCGCGGGDISDCSTNPDKDCDKPQQKPKCANPYFKHKNECWPYKGPGTPQNNKAALDQTGVQILSGSGHTLVMDDSVDEPRGDSRWERSLKDFDFGCNDITRSRFYVKSATGHEISMDDDEEDTNVRSNRNGIRLRTATGNLIEANDHTIKGDGQTDGSKRAGKDRGILLKSTSNHVVQLCDQDNEQASPDRKEGGERVNKAKKAYILIRTGYGLQILMGDRSSQQETQDQFITILSPQKDNKERGPHQIYMAEKKEGAGLVFLRAGGNFVVQTYDECLEVVGDAEKNPSNKISVITNKYIINTTDIHFHYSGKQHIFFAEDKIFLLAGRDGDQEVSDGNGQSHIEKHKVPTAYNVVINRNTCPCPLIPWMHHFTPGRSTSERVFASGLSPADAPSSCGGQGDFSSSDQGQGNQ